jgi:sarcosine oxidase subunit beta
VTNRADVAIVGAGIVGLSCAFELAREGVERIVVFDKGGPVYGTTGGSAGVICPVELGDPYVLMGLLGYERVQQLAGDHGLRFERSGRLQLVYEPDDPAVDRHGVDARFGGDDPRSIHHAEVLDVGGVLEVLPWAKTRADGDRRRVLAGGRFYPNQGFVNAYELVTAYERLVRASGRVSLQWCTPVLRMERAGDTVASLVTRRGAWQVGQVLNAGGPWGVKVAELAGSTLPLTPQRVQVCVAAAPEARRTAPLTGIPEVLEGESVWCRGEEGGMLLFGQHHHVTRPGERVDPDHVNRANDDDYPQRVASHYRPYWSLPADGFMGGWCCVYGTTTDGYPIVAKDLQLDNLFHAVGMNGHGVTIHPAIAMSVCALMLHGSRTLDLHDRLGMRASLDLSLFDIARLTTNAVPA